MARALDLAPKKWPGAGTFKPGHPGNTRTVTSTSSIEFMLSLPGHHWLRAWRPYLESLPAAHQKVGGYTATRLHGGSDRGLASNVTYKYDAPKRNDKTRPNNPKPTVSKLVGAPSQSAHIDKINAEGWRLQGNDGNVNTELVTSVKGSWWVALGEVDNCVDMAPGEVDLWRGGGLRGLWHHAELAYA